MNCFDKFEELLKNDVDGALYNRLLSTTESKLLSGHYFYESYSDDEVMTLVYSMASFREWDINYDYWDMDSENDTIEDHKFDIISEYPSRKLCCLIDTLAPANEIKNWYKANWGVNSRMMSTTESSYCGVDQKILAWGDQPVDSAEHFAENLSENEIHTLIELGSNIPFWDLETTWGKYQIVSKYIRSSLCYMIDQRDSAPGIERWYKLFLAFHHYE